MIRNVCDPCCRFKAKLLGPEQLSAHDCVMRFA